jgi:hypothetical protein
MFIRKILNCAIPFIFLAAMVYFAACDEKAIAPTDPPPPPPNPYGNGKGKITFIRKQHIDGPVIIIISGREMNDTIIWQNTPSCDTNLAVSQILPAGSYPVRIEGSEFMCNYNVTVEERVCKIQEYTNCAGGYIGCTGIEGIWLRTADGPCPNCQGLKVEFREGFGEVIYTPPGCRFPIGDIKWRDFNLGSCTMLDLARDQYGGSPGYQNAELTFENRNSFVIHSESGEIPYSRIAQLNDNKKSENTDRSIIFSVTSDTNRLPVAR